MTIEYADKKLARGILDMLAISKPLPRKGRQLIVALPNGKTLTVSKWNNLLYQVSVH